MKRKYKVLIIAVVVALVFSALFIYKKNCKDEECFNEALYQCTPAKYFGYRNNNLYLYKISRSLFRDCNLKVEVERMAIGSDPDLIRLLEKKQMKCKIPKDMKLTLDKMENLLTYCNGELKEGLYQLMLERLYALVVRDMKGIIDEAEKALKV